MHLTKSKMSRTINIKLTSLLFAIATLLMLAACTTPSTQAPAQGIRAKTEPAPMMSEQLLNYLLTARAMTPTDFASEKERVRAEFLHDKTEFNRMKLAILISLLPATGPSITTTPLAAAANIAEDTELTTLLEPFTNSLASSSNATSPDLRGLAMLIQGLVQDRKKLREQLKDSLNRTQITRRDELSSQSEARILRAKVEELEKKLDALKSIERSVGVKSDARNGAAPLTRTDGTTK